MKFLEVENLTISFGNKVVVNSVSFDLAAGERLGVIGESGSGKTMIALAVIGLLPDTATATGSIRLAGEELLRLSDQQMSAYRGKQLAMVFQEPLTALNPLMRVGKQIAQPLLNHDKASVGLPDPEHIVRAYPHQLSGGQRQRIGLAIAIACSPKLLIVDEPTTALDVTVQKEVLQTINDLVEQQGSSLIFISHDLPVVSTMAEDIAVLRNGELVEHANITALFNNPQHEYSKKLVDLARATEKEFSDFTKSSTL
ncbi:MAG: ABC transporter ATP-binding protein [Actinobacteria bacterium]|nr:ABC transporter ATP-binding protein [Actinomycetota bacterium]